MPVIMEVVAELHAAEFVNGHTGATGQVLKYLPDGPFVCSLSKVARGVKAPDDAYPTVAAAKEALIAYWHKCDEAFASGPSYGWTPVV